MHYPTYKTVVIVFLITAAWDVALRFLAQGDVRAFGVERMRWVLNLRPYFEQHTLLSAALVAGFVGAVTLPLITVSATPTKPPQSMTTSVGSAAAPASRRGAATISPQLSWPA